MNVSCLSASCWSATGDDHQRADAHGADAGRGALWITALRAPQIQLPQVGSLELSSFDQRDLAKVSDPAYPGGRLIACRNPLMAAERARRRHDLLAAIEHQLEGDRRSDET